ncbi:MAG: site-specific integrase [Bacteroidales bacterium]|jgi:integrase|nr:site-specific integrase [Bacteroidales bacterium]
MKARKSLEIKRFKLEQRKDKKTGIVITENVPILVEFKFDGQRVIYPIGYRIDSDKWNDEAGRVKNNNFNRDKTSAGTINKRINRISEYLPTIYNDAVEHDLTVTKQYLWSELLNKLKDLEGISDDIGDKKILSIPDYIQLFIDNESKAKNWTESTIKKIKTIKSHVEDYSKKYGRILHFNDITEDFLQNYIDYLRKDKKLNNTTNYKYMILFKWFMNWATKKRYNKNLEYKTFEYKFKGTGIADYQKNIVFLSWNELQHFINFDFSENKRLEQIRDVYCFCCLTGLRFSDAHNLKKNDFKTDDSGNPYIEITTIKTDDSLIIELNKYALAIWEKYKDIDLKNNRAFPVPSNQKFNKYLKDAGKDAEFNSIETYIEYRGNKRIDAQFKKWELLSHHTARKTFIINALYLGIQPDIIMKWTGHKDSKTMAVYTKVVKEQKQLSMNKFNER